MMDLGAGRRLVVAGCLVVVAACGSTAKGGSGSTTRSSVAHPFSSGVPDRPSTTVTASSLPVDTFAAHDWLLPTRPGEQFEVAVVEADGTMLGEYATADGGGVSLTTIEPGWSRG